MVTVADCPDHLHLAMTRRIRSAREAEHGDGSQTHRPLGHLSQGVHGDGAYREGRHRQGSVGTGWPAGDEVRRTTDVRRQTSRKRRTAKAEPTTPTTMPTTATRRQVPKTSHPLRDIWAMMLPWLAAVLLVSRPMPQ